MATNELNLTSGGRVKVYLDGRVIADGVRAETVAASPEMLEALRAAFWVMEDAFGHANAPYQQAAHEALNAVRAALAKAEGK